MGEPIKIINHSRAATQIAERHGWMAGARYTNLRDVRHVRQAAFLDIDWKRYDFERHIHAANAVRPVMTVARDVERASELDEILEQASCLAKYCQRVIVVPKDPDLAPHLSSIPRQFLLGYSVPTRYAGTSIGPARFGRRQVHLLGGRPDVQRQLGRVMNVVSLDCNRFTLDARFGDYFDGETFRPHPEGSYERCLEDSIVNINKLWADYGSSHGRGVQ